MRRTTKLALAETLGPPAGLLLAAVVLIGVGYVYGWDFFKAVLAYFAALFDKGAGAVKNWFQTSVPSGPQNVNGPVGGGGGDAW